MASSLVSALEENLKCTLCHSIYNTPVILLCTHSFCKSCLEENWAEQRANECPLCRKRSSVATPPVNRALKSACESFLQERSRRITHKAEGLLCSEHDLNLQLFCMHDEQLVCAKCVTEQHNNHNFCSISKAASENREELRGPLQELQANHVAFASEKLTCVSISQEIQSQFMNTQMQIKKEFEKLYRFLKEEEESRLAALKKEEERKAQKMKDRIEEMDGFMSSLSRRIKHIEDHMNTEDSLFLKNLKDVEESAEYTVPDLKEDHGALIDVSKHLGNLRYRVWEKMKDICPYYPVILEPNSANSRLHLSADLIKVTCRDTKQNLPNNRERFAVDPVILGSESLGSGTHSWVVDVGESENWTIGLVKESVKRKDKLSVSPQDGFWTISRNDGSYSFNTRYLGAERVRRIRVQVDWNNNKVTFTNPESNIQLHTYAHTREKMYPYFSTISDIPLKILPAKVSMAVS
ncbi:nuclear factor 7, brain-like isoform X2 [Electrophorus electricus]|uniref:nuclear factor 7, brain-like isoform X2 n=1 Tax=Electrophorus electricus TaxID=8005 RepID=UPI0015D05E57|nr:nuclear factor 7, brain-like isoform X2 [Electrophorus electricus]